MLLLYNVIIDKIKKDKYDKIFSDIFRSFNCDFAVKYLEDKFDESELSGYSHLLVTGSELFASESNWQNEKVFRIIDIFAKQDKAILGICYGHQMIAKTLAGPRACRKAKQPEFGWKKISLTPNPLFEGIKNRVFYESHYDEVSNLNNSFNIIATDEEGIVQAFQYKNLPIWGVQFHPEIDYENGENSIQERFKKQPELKKYYRNEMNKAENFEERLLIFKNFITA
ncbi:MAG: hypothetical protein DRZ79_03825 [Candidatus Cloacimonadota bacterium]|nr:MAG: hypothetical protein DRZ79_03825 [Candidatus Cloacimonadota bacterium]